MSGSICTNSGKRQNLDNLVNTLKNSREMYKEIFVEEEATDLSRMEFLPPLS